MPPRLRQAYLQTHYSVDGCAIRIGCRTPAIDALLALRSAREGVLVTAWNPQSRRMPRGWNDRMQRRLSQRLRRFAVLNGESGHGPWREEQLLVLAPIPLVLRVGRVFRQWAVVAVRRGQCAQLVPVPRGLACARHGHAARASTSPSPIQFAI